MHAQADRRKHRDRVTLPNCRIAPEWFHLDNEMMKFPLVRILAGQLPYFAEG